MTRFIVVPQWQGSPSSRAMRLAEGAELLRADLPSQATVTVPVPLEAGDDEGTGIARYSSLRIVRDRVAEALAASDEPAVIVGGDCAVAAAGIDHAARQPGRLAVVWLDAHPDLNTPASSPSAAFAGMVLRTLVDEGAIAADQIVLAGTRSWDADEEGFARDHGIRSLTAADLDAPGALADAVAATGAERVFVHLDLDVLDPGSLASLLAPEPFGAAPTAVADSIRAVLAAVPLAGASLAAFAPGSPGDAVDDAPTVLRMIAALTA